MSKQKIVFKATITCPHCDEDVDVKDIRSTVSEAVKAEYEHEIEVKKSEQTKLTDKE